MSHDEFTPSWRTESSFERRPGGDGEEPAPAWEHELVRWSTPEQNVPEPDPVEPSAGEAPVDPFAVEPPAPVEPTAAEPSVGEPAPAAPAPASLDHSWLTQPLEEISEPVVAPPDPTPSPDPTPAPVFEQEPDVGAPVVQLPVAPLPPPIDEPDLEPELEAELEPDPAAEADPDSFDFGADDEPGEKVPFYKRELSFKRTPKAKKTKKPKQEKPKKEKRKRERAPKGEDGDGVKAPFYKRELSFKRSKPDRGPEDDPGPKADRPKRAKRELPKLRRPSLSRPERGGGGAGGKNAKKLVGLKVGASQIAAARVSNDEFPQLLQAVSSPLEHGVVVGGELRDPEALAVALREFFKRHNLPRKGIRLGIANNRIGVRTLDVVGIADPRQLDNAVKFRAQEVLPIPIEDAVLDYQVLSESVDADGQPSCRVLLVVAYRDLVDRYVDACQKAGLELVGIDLEAFALLRSLAEPPSELQPLPGVERGAIVAVAVGHDRTTFAISDGRTCEFTRVLQWGGWSLNVAIARVLDTSPSEAEAVKRALSFNGLGGAPPQGFSEEQLATALEAARGQLHTFARELVSSLQFYQNQPGSLGIGEIVITGGTSHLQGLGEELERLVGVPVRVGDPLTRVRLGKGVGDLEQVGSLAVAIGLGIDD